MKVAVVSESFLPHVNGVTGSVLQVLGHLRRTGHEALVIAPGEPPRTCEGFDVVALPSVGFPGYPQVRVPVGVNGRLARELAAFAPDVVHLASPFVLGGPVVRVAASLHVPVVAASTSAVAELVGDGVGRSARPEPPALAAAVAALLAVPEDERRAAARARAESFPWSRTTDTMLALHGQRFEV